MTDIDSTSSFTGGQPSFPDAELLSVGGTTCQCYRVRLYGKLHFLKRLKPELRTHPQYVAALQKEFETGYSLDHPHLVRYVSKTDDGILMDYVDGETLSQFAENHPDYFKSRKNADRFLRQLLSVVGYLHSHQIVHLDLKPGNILITRVGNDVKLVDLGYCYTDTYIDTMGRTDKYAAPEQLDGSAKVDARTDIYAIGRILQTLPCASYYNKVIRRCTADDPANRYQNVDEVGQTLSPRHSYHWLWLLLIPLAASLLFLLSRSSDGGEQVEQENDAASVAKDSAIVVPSQEVHRDSIFEKPKPSANSPASSPSVAEEASLPQEETLALRRELQSIAQPIFDKMLATYLDSSYKAVGFSQYGELTDDFRTAIMQHYHPLWERYRQKSTISERTFYWECSETWLYYVNNLYYQMQRNDGNAEYEGKQYHYYDSQKKDHGL